MNSVASVSAVPVIPRELVVEAEVVLERDRRQGLVLLADPHALLRLDRLVQAVGPAPALEDAAGELVDDLHLAVDHRVVGVALEQRLGLQRLDQVVDERAVLGDVEVVDPEELLGLRRPRPRSARPSCASRRTRSRARPRRCRATRRATSASASSPRRPSAWPGGRTCSRCRRPARAGPEMISGVRASSMRMLSTSSTIANACSRWTHSSSVRGHVVAQVVEAELGVGPVGDVAGVHLRAARPGSSPTGSRRPRRRAGRRSASSTSRRGGRGSR